MAVIIIHHRYASIYKSQYIQVLHNHHLWQVLWGVALVWLDDLAADQLLVSVSRVYDLLALDDSQSLEAVALSKLAAPVAADSESTALDIVV